jgi:hypothetical protein
LYLYLSPVRAILLDVSLVVAAGAAELPVLLHSGGRGAVAAGRGASDRNGAEDLEGLRGAHAIEHIRGKRLEGALDSRVVRVVLPTDLGDNAVEGIGLGEIGEGLADMAHFSLQSAGKADDGVLRGLSHLDRVAERIHSGLDREVIEVTEGGVNPGLEGLFYREEAALGKGVWAGAAVRGNGSRAQEAAGDGHVLPMGCQHLREGGCEVILHKCGVFQASVNVLEEECMMMGGAGFIVNPFAVFDGSGHGGEVVWIQTTVGVALCGLLNGATSVIFEVVVV